MSYNKETGMYEGYIYKIVNDINDKVYIGQTKRSLSIRFQQHLSKTRHKEDNSILHKAIEKYGCDSFYIKEVSFVEQETEQLLFEKLNELEKFYISKYNSISPYGYNILTGGNICPIEHKAHPIYKFSMDGVFLEKFPTITDGLLSVGETNTKSCRISYHLKTDACAYGYLWSDRLDKNPLIQYTEFKNQKKKKQEESKRKRKKGKSYIVAKYDEDMNFVKYYFSRKSLLEDNKSVSTTSLNRILKSEKISLYKNSYWFYADDIRQPDITKVIAR